MIDGFFATLYNRNETISTPRCGFLCKSIFHSIWLLRLQHCKINIEIADIFRLKNTNSRTFSGRLQQDIIAHTCRTCRVILCYSAQRNNACCSAVTTLCQLHCCVAKCASPSAV